MNIITNNLRKNNININFSGEKHQNKSCTNIIGSQFKSKANSEAFYGKDLLIDKRTSEPISEELKILFDDLNNKKDKEFADTAYKGLIKYYKLEGIAPKEIEWKQSSGNSKLDIVSDYQWFNNKIVLYEDNFLNSGKTKEEQLGFIAHEITHMNQMVNIMRTDELPMTTVATAFAIFDFNSTLLNNPAAQMQFRQAKQNGKEKEYSIFVIKHMAQKNYKELSNAFKDVLTLPKHPLKSQNGQKALRDLDSWSKYNSQNWNTYTNILVEKEAMDEENKMRAIYRNYTKNSNK